jgi:phage terminase large subunit
MCGKVSIRLIRIAAFDSPDNVTYYLGADWGFSVDPSVLIRCRVDGRKLYIDYEAYMVGCEIDQLPMLFDRVPDSRKFFITADSARPETISYMQRHGFPKINKASKGKGSIEDGIEFLQSFDIIVHPRCVETIKELTMYSYKVDKLTGQVQPHLEDKENHVIDALRYSLESARKFTKTQNRTIILPKHTYRDRSAGY